ncbi:MAG: ribosome biogenesis GTPase Der [Gemmatimonadetes bacterium]|nr:ribosome biogenesis GTPase Der [Gemmatimonadota bacterium]MYE71566.1 ribosome biogenesis GTPase Der [Gemmatimonadota bacterium]MYJ69635.1 ribosome biogenesis GTPase Der [Gemmatimonadota bacterium]
MSLPVVAVVGRPNVGKSTFFNRAIGRRVAIVDDEPGVTRDRNFGRAEWTGRHFYVVDTGGVVEGSNRTIDRLIRKQAMTAVEEADAVLLMVDSKAGVHPLDQKLAEVLRKVSKPVLLTVNKVDNLPLERSHLDFWELGMGEPYPVSSMSGRGFGDLFDAMLPLLPEETGEPIPGEVRVAVIGKPNAGKSSLVNRLFGQERVMVSEVPGTTRDPVDLTMTYHGRQLTFVDTAGLRRHARIRDSVEYYSTLRTARVVRDAAVCLVVIDAAEGLHVQDIKVAETAWEAGCGVIAVCNKWDLVAKDTWTAPDFQRDAGSRAPFLRHVPFLFVSALTGLRVRKTLELVLAVAERRRRRVPTHEVNELVEELVRRQPPPHARGRAVRIKYATQAETEPPTFILFSNLPDEIPVHYRRFLVNGMRDRWDFPGVPLRLRLRKSKR